MYAIKAVYDGNVFIPMQPIPVNGEYEVVITFIEPKKFVDPNNKGAVRPPMQYNTMAGEIWMADDFDEPLEDFKEYME